MFDRDVRDAADVGQTIIKAQDVVSYQKFSTPEELSELIANDLALMLTEHFIAKPRVEVPLNAPAMAEQRFFNLPAQRGPLIDRTSELTTTRTLLMRKDTGLVTLTGPGGVGKTRLGVQVAAELCDSFTDGLFVVTDSLTRIKEGALLEFTRRHRLPTMFEFGTSVRDGGLISYGPNIAEMAPRAAAFVDKILKGARPGDLPVQATASTNDPRIDLGGVSLPSLTYLALRGASLDEVAELLASSALPRLRALS